MKSIKAILFTLFMVSALSVCAKSPSMTADEKEAQSTIMNYLTIEGIQPMIDPNDNSINFKINGIFYWITIKEQSSNVLLYTFYRKGLRSDDTDGNGNTLRPDISALAANKLNATETYKTVQIDDKVRFYTQMYAQNCNAFTAAFHSMLNSFQNAKDEFDKYYTELLKKTPKPFNSTSKHDNNVVIVEQPVTVNVQASPVLTVKSIAVQNVDRANNVITGYDLGIRKNKCNFVQPRIYAEALSKGYLQIGVRIYTPEGKLLLPEAGAKYTSVSYIETKKSKEPMWYELAKFGTDNGNLWKAGEYRIEFYEGDTLIYTDSINIL